MRLGTADGCVCSTGDARTPSVAWSAAEARSWLERAAASPTAEGAAAACELADLLLAGAPPDVPAALKLLEAAMDRGSAAAAPALARMLGLHPRVRLRCGWSACERQGRGGVAARGPAGFGGGGRCVVRRVVLVCFGRSFAAARGCTGTRG
jgi:hypothetical protein